MSLLGKKFSGLYGNGLSHPPSEVKVLRHRSQELTYVYSATNGTFLYCRYVNNPTHNRDPTVRAAILLALASVAATHPSSQSSA